MRYMYAGFLIKQINTKKTASASSQKINVYTFTVEKLLQQKVSKSKMVFSSATCLNNYH